MPPPRRAGRLGFSGKLPAAPPEFSDISVFLELGRRFGPAWGGKHAQVVIQSLLKVQGGFGSRVLALSDQFGEVIARDAFGTIQLFIKKFKF